MQLRPVLSVFILEIWISVTDIFLPGWKFQIHYTTYYHVKPISGLFTDSWHLISLTIDRTSGLLTIAVDHKNTTFTIAAESMTEDNSVQTLSHTVTFGGKKYLKIKVGPVETNAWNCKDLII